MNKLSRSEVDKAINKMSIDGKIEPLELMHYALKYCDIDSDKFDSINLFEKQLGLQCNDKKSLKYAEQGMNTILYNFIINSTKYKKIRKILNNNKCKNCKYSKIKFSGPSEWIPEGHYYNVPSDSVVCNSCIDRQEMLIDLQQKLTNVSDELITDEIIAMRATLNNFKTKLKNYVTSKQ